MKAIALFFISLSSKYPYSGCWDESSPGWNCRASWGCATCSAVPAGHLLGWEWMWAKWMWHCRPACVSSLRLELNWKWRWKFELKIQDWNLIKKRGQYLPKRLKCFLPGPGQLFLAHPPRNASHGLAAPTHTNKFNFTASEQALFAQCNDLHFWWFHCRNTNASNCTEERNVANVQKNGLLRISRKNATNWRNWCAR